MKLGVPENVIDEFWSEDQLHLSLIAHLQTIYLNEIIDIGKFLLWVARILLLFHVSSETGSVCVWFSDRCVVFNLRSILTKGGIGYKSGGGKGGN